MASNRQAASIEGERAILATIARMTANVDWLTSDRIEALTGGHGKLLPGFVHDLVPKVARGRRSVWAGVPGSKARAESATMLACDIAAYA